jgi:hypothetical protein
MTIQHYLSQVHCVHYGTLVSLSQAVSANAYSLVLGGEEGRKRSVLPGVQQVARGEVPKI